jgi:hypothetical protein
MSVRQLPWCVKELVHHLRTGVDIEWQTDGRVGDEEVFGLCDDMLKPVTTTAFGKDHMRAVPTDCRPAVAFELLLQVLRRMPPHFALTELIQLQDPSATRSSPQELDSGYLGELYFQGTSWTWSAQGNTWHLVFGAKGTATGSTRWQTESGADAEGLLVQFPGNKSEVKCRFNELSLTPPSDFQGGYRIDGEAYYTGEDQEVDGARPHVLTYGAKGTILGLAGASKRTKGEGLTLLFPGNSTPAGCYFTELSLTDPKVHAPPHAPTPALPCCALHAVCF